MGLKDPRTFYHNFLEDSLPQELRPEKNLRQWKKPFKQPLEIVSKSIMEGTMDCFEKSCRDARVAFYRPVMLFFVNFTLIHNKCENIRQINADTYHKF